MDRTSKFILRRIIIDVLCLLVVSFGVLTFYLFGRPYKRGFFCDDESLYHPFHESTVTSTTLYVTGLFLPICTMIIGEYLYARNHPDNPDRVFFGYTIPTWLWKAYTKVGVFGFGAACTVLTTDIAKYTIGRLRPHFMEVCAPSVNCSLPEFQHKYIEDFFCTANSTPHMLKESRLSFPSGHSSFSAYTMVYLAMYLQLRITWPGSKLLKHVLQLACLWMAWYTAMTRVSNYKHHWSDVLAGSSLGVSSALLVGFCVANLFAERKEQHLLEEKRRSDDYDTEAATQIPLRIVQGARTYGGVERMTEQKS